MKDNLTGFPPSALMTSYEVWYIGRNGRWTLHTRCGLDIAREHKLRLEATFTRAVIVQATRTVFDASLAG